MRRETDQTESVSFCGALSFFVFSLETEALDPPSAYSFMNLNTNRLDRTHRICYSMKKLVKANQQ